MKEENIKGEYQRKVDKSLIPTCNIMGVNIAAINMNWLLKYIDENLSDIKGDYIVKCFEIPVVFLTGPGGIGKSQIARETVFQAKSNKSNIIQLRYHQ